jgi:hypothetical protein
MMKLGSSSKIHNQNLKYFKRKFNVPGGKRRERMSKSYWFFISHTKLIIISNLFLENSQTSKYEYVE